MVLAETHRVREWKFSHPYRSREKSDDTTNIVPTFSGINHDTKILENQCEHPARFSQAVAPIFLVRVWSCCGKKQVAELSLWTRQQRGLLLHTTVVKAACKARGREQYSRGAVGSCIVVPRTPGKLSRRGASNTPAIPPTRLRATPWRR